MSKSENRKKVPGVVENSAGKKFFLSWRAKLAFILVGVSVCVYANTLRNGYALDDNSVIAENSIVTKGVTAIPEILCTPYRKGFFTTTNDLYRPLSLVMFAIEYQVFDNNPLAGHLINVLLFAACIVLLFIFLDRLFDGEKTVTAFIASLLFALHPIHTEVVANIKGRDDLLCFFFSFLGLLMVMRYQQAGKMKHLAAGAALFFLALLSKETAITFLVVIPLIFFFYKKEYRKRSIAVVGCCTLAALVFLVIRFSVLHASHADAMSDISFIDNELVKAPSLVSAFATKILILGKYLALLFVPYPLVCDYSYNSIPYVTFKDMAVLGSLAAYLLLAVLGVVRLVRFGKDPFAFGILYFFVTISLFSNIPFLIGAAMAERFLFFASVGFCLLIALLIERWVVGSPGEPGFSVLTKKKLLLVILPIVGIYAAITINRNADWADNVILYKADIKNAPDNARLYYFLANELQHKSATEETDPAVKIQIAKEAIGYLNKAIAIYPDYNDAQRVAGNCYFITGDLDAAAVHMNRALMIKPDDMEALHNLDVVYFNQQKYLQSIALCHRILAIDSNAVERYNNMGICYLRLDRSDSAIFYLKIGFQKAPDFNSFSENLALAYKMEGNNDSAIKYELIADQHNPGFRVN